MEFLPSEKQGMARVVCDELARQAYDSSTDVFVKRLIQLRELSEDWSQIDGLKDNNSAAAAEDKKMVRVSQLGEYITSGNDMSDNEEDNDVCDVSMVCDEIPSTSDFTGQERQPRPVSRGRGRPRGSGYSSGVGRGMSVPQRLQILAKKHRVVPPGQSCDDCGKSFRYVACLERHKRIVHGNKQTTFENPATNWLNLDPELINEANNMTSFQCTECPKVCSTIQELCWHVRVHNMRTFKPKSDPAQQPATVDLEDALLEIASDDFKCGVCERRFRSQQELVMHMASNAEAHECPECGRRMENAFYLRVHRLIHKQPHNLAAKKKEPTSGGSMWKKGPMQCPLCGSMFKTYAGYQDHVNAVHEKKKFICDVCARQCSRRSQLTRHMLTHGGERRFECGKCGRRFLLREMLRRHLRAVHARVRPHLCNLCGRPFAEKHQLNTHMKVHRR